jgi:hypothetical protein
MVHARVAMRDVAPLRMEVSDGIRIGTDADVGQVNRSGWLPASYCVYSGDER